MKHRTCLQFLVLFVLLAATSGPHAATQAAEVFRAGAHVVDISPTTFPVIVNAMMTERSATGVTDRLYARALALDDGKTRIVFCVVDTCMMPRDLIDRAKELASQQTGLPTDRMLVSATHTHSTPAAMGCLGSRVDAGYAAYLPTKIAEAIAGAVRNLEPARVGWAVVDDWQHTFNRRWIRRPDKAIADPFGNLTVRANMHPGHQNPDAIGPSGPVDPALSILSVQSRTGRPLALLANYSQHYYGSPLLSSDYFGRFVQEIAALVGEPNSKQPFVGIMSQGTSGDLMWMDYNAPRNDVGYVPYAKALAQNAFAAYRTIQYRDWAPLKMAERTLALNYRFPDADRLAWARKVAATLEGRLPKTLPEIYALEAISLHERPRTELKLQAVRIGDLGIAAIPNEVYAITGLKLKAQSPLQPLFNIELAGGAEGYIPPPEQHKLGGYSTWNARTAGLETQAEPRIVETLLSLLEEVAGQPRRKIEETHGPFAKAVLDAKPAAYWRLNEMVLPTAFDATGQGHAATYDWERGVAFYLPGAGTGSGAAPALSQASPAFSGPAQINRAPHFAGGSLKAELPQLGENYSVAFWLWNGLDPKARATTGIAFARGDERLGITGASAEQSAGPGRLFFKTSATGTLLVGKTTLRVRDWHYVVLVREGRRVALYLDGKPELEGEAPVAASGTALFLGGKPDEGSTLEGKLDEAAVFDRPLKAEEIAALFQAAATTDEALPLAPEESLKKIHVPAGYKVELVAAEPLVLDPVAFDWDERGRLWVVEMADYPLGMDGKGQPGGRVRILEDANGDGRFDKSTLFADGLNFPNGILTWRDGCLVTAAPDVLFLKDRDGDGRADGQQKLLSGFNTGNQQLRVNGLRWGLDGWVYCANGGHHVNYGKEIKIVSHLTGEKIALGARDFRFKPDTGEFDPLSGPSQFGRTRDAWGNWFGVQNSYPLWHYVLEDRYLRRNPHVAPPSPRVFLTESNPPVYPASPQEKRFHSFGQAGHFTSACGPSFDLDTLLFGTSPVRNSFTCEPFHNLVQHLVIEDDGVTFKAHRNEAEKIDFFASEDRWCRPVMTRTGPDGALWVADMYRYMIEHPEWLPPQGKEELLPHYRKGDDKGRLYRVSPSGAQLPAFKDLSSLKTDELVARLESHNGWMRDKAQMLLLWRADKSAVPALESMARSGKTLGRLHALSTLEGLAALPPATLVHALHDADAGVRIQALRLAENHHDDAVVLAAAQLADDTDAKVRLQLACSLGAWKQTVAGEALAKIALKDGDNIFLRSAVLSSLMPHLSTFAAKTESDPSLLEATFQTAWGEQQPAVVLELLERLLTLDNTADAQALRRVRAVLMLLRSKNTTLESLATKHATEPRWAALVQSKNKLFAALKSALPQATVPYQALYASLLMCDPAEASAATEALGRLIAPRNQLDPLAEFVGLLVQSGDARVPDFLMVDWDLRLPAERDTILDAMMGREAWALGLLARVQDDKLAPASFDAQRRARLIQHPSPKVRELAAKVFAATAGSTRQKVLEAFRPALSLTGDPAKGKAVFAKACIACHQLEGVGKMIGPDLRSVVSHPAEKLFSAILDPSADIQPGYTVYVCELTSGLQLFGIVAGETGGSLTLKLADGTTRAILRQDIEFLKSSKVSLMPEGLEAGQTPQTLADLIAYLKQPK